MREDRAAWKARVQSLVEEYRRTGSAVVRDTIVLDILGVIKERAHKIGAPYRIQKKFLVGYGVEGLLAALERYGEAHTSGAHFMTYATGYIMGHIYKGLACENERYRQALEECRTAQYQYGCAFKRGENPGEKPTVTGHLDRMPRMVAYNGNAHSWAHADDARELARWERTILDQALEELGEREQFVLEKIHCENLTAAGVARRYKMKAAVVKQIGTMALRKLCVAYLRRDGSIIR